MSLTQDEWLRRYRAQFTACRPAIAAEKIDELVTVEAWQVLGEEYPDNPERAADDEIFGWTESYCG